MATGFGYDADAAAHVAQALSRVRSETLLPIDSLSADASGSGSSAIDAALSHFIDAVDRAETGLLVSVEHASELFDALVRGGVDLDRMLADRSSPGR